MEAAAMSKIICLMGKSATGKDTIFRELMRDESLGLKNIVPYTTRPIRQGERDGAEYHFVDEPAYESLRKAGRIIEARAYRTMHGVWRYFTVADEGLSPELFNYCMIGTLEAYVSIRAYFGPEKVLPVLVELDDGERLQRALDRERSQESPRYEEMCRRFLADSIDFSEEKISEAGIEKRFCNKDLDKCLAEVTAYIREKIKTADKKG